MSKTRLIPLLLLVGCLFIGVKYTVEAQARIEALELANKELLAENSRLSSGWMLEIKDNSALKKAAKIVIDRNKKLEYLCSKKFRPASITGLYPLYM